MTLTAAEILPDDGCAGALVGRIWQDDGPHVVAARDGGLFDLSRLAPTISDLLDLDAPAQAVRAHAGQRLMSLDEALAQRVLLAPCDLAAIKAAGVTFADSLIERVIEERAKGDPAAAEQLRAELGALLGGSLTGLKPGSPAAMQLKAALIERGLWSQYLEVGIGPDAEVFTKAQPMSAVGCGAEIGLHPKSEWNNPEPEDRAGLLVARRGRWRGARQRRQPARFRGPKRAVAVEGQGQQRLLRHRPLHPPVRRDLRHRRRTPRPGAARWGQGTTKFRVAGRDTRGGQHQSRSAGPGRRHLRARTSVPGRFHAVPGLPMYVPTADRRGPGSQGFTHEEGRRGADQLRQARARWSTPSPPSNAAPPWTFGARALMRSLAARRLLLN